MTSPFTRIGWNKYEVALLIDAYNEVSSGELARKDAVSMLSKRLRNRMISHGIEISEKYRNENGIALQLSAIEYCMTNGEKGFGNPARIFWDITEMYSGERDEFHALLLKAMTMYPKPVKQYQPAKETGHGLVSEPIVDMECKTSLRLKEILRTRFSKGYRLGSVIARKQLCNYYDNLYGHAVALADDKLDEMVAACGVIIDGRVYMPELLMGNDVQRRIKDFIERTFDSGKNYIFYSAILKQFSSELLDNSHIASCEMLKTSLSYCFSEKWHFAEEYLSDSEDVVLNIDDEVVEYIFEQGRVVTDNEVIESLSLLPEDAIRQSILSNPEILISNGRNQRFHIDIFTITSQELEAVAKIISLGISQFGFISSEELLSDIKQKVPEILLNNPDISDIGIRNVLAVKLRGRFSFNRSVISEMGKNISSVDALKAFCRSHNEFTIDEITNLAEMLGTLINAHLDKLYRYSLRIDDIHFVSTKSMKFDVEGTDAALSVLVNDDYIPIVDIDTFATFPSAKYPWNSRLLESYLLTSSKAFSLISGRYLGRDHVSGAVVKKSSTYESFDDIIVDVLAKSDVSLTKENALDLLAEKKYIIRRSYSGIELLMIKAKELRNKLNR